LIDRSIVLFYSLQVIMETIFPANLATKIIHKYSSAKAIDFKQLLCKILCAP